MKVYFQIAECSLSSAKINIKMITNKFLPTNRSFAMNTFYKIVHSQ